MPRAVLSGVANQRHALARLAVGWQLAASPSPWPRHRLPIVRRLEEIAADRLGAELAERSHLQFGLQCVAYALHRTQA